MVITKKLIHHLEMSIALNFSALLYWQQELSGKLGEAFFSLKNKIGLVLFCSKCSLKYRLTRIE